MKCVFKSGL